MDTDYIGSRGDADYIREYITLDKMGVDRVQYLGFVRFIG